VRLNGGKGGAASVPCPQLQPILPVRRKACPGTPGAFRAARSKLPKVNAGWPVCPIAERIEAFMRHAKIRAFNWTIAQYALYKGR
jgi:hypothetical protein